MPQNTNPLTEVGVVMAAGLLIIGGVLLLYVGKIDFTAATLMFGSALALFGGNLALKAPSPSQQAQIGQQQQQIGVIAQNQQQLTSQVLSVLPTVVSAASGQQPAPAPLPSQVQPPPVQPSQPQSAMAALPQALSSPWSTNIARPTPDGMTTNTFPLPTVPRQ